MKRSLKLFMEDWGLYIFGLALGSVWYYEILSGIASYLALLVGSLMILYSFYLDYRTIDLLQEGN